MNLSAELFQDHLQTSFFIPVQAEEKLELTLNAIQIRPEDKSPYHQFSLFFLCSGELQLQQGSYLLQHSSLPDMQLFLVPVANSGQTYTYQASFTIEKSQLG
ncbi:DUF6916 family protein [Undibacterium curvum]|jgi:hypothetical protein|uniref:DUF6916 family protein n=1 Tax=Undibacterium curvum TaxID=2762294 RepID=UPI003D112447